VDDAGAVFRGRVVGEVDRRDAVVAGIHGGERMAELEPLELLAERGRDDRAFEAEARQALLDQRAREQQQSARRVDERILELRIEVERLVRGQRPRRRRPDDGERVPWRATAGRTRRRAWPDRRRESPTSTVGDLRSSYSISNSASDEPQSKHQCTGFRPR
jgi:hypothetical protein